MSTDFRASQVRTSKIIATGSTGTPAALLIYGHEQDGVPPYKGHIADTFNTSSIGSDAFIYISGSENKRTVLAGGMTLSGSVVALQGLPLGHNFSDLDYQQGLFENWAPTTTIGHALIEVNNLLKGMAPAKPPFLSNINSNNSGQTGLLTIDESHQAVVLPSITVPYRPNPSKLIDQNCFPLVVATTTSLGIFPPSVSFTGILANNVPLGPGTPYSSYAANAFHKADVGTLSLFVNDEKVREVDLATAGEVNDLSTGFVLTNTSSVVFSTTGVEFSSFKYRTGSWKVDPANQVYGFNNVRIEHNVNGTIYSTNQVDWFVDGNEKSISFSNEQINSLTLSGLKYLSGVKYYTGGYLQYAITASNIYANATYSSSSITYTESYGLQAITPDSLLPSLADYEKQVEILKIVDFENSDIRLIDGSVTVSTTIPTVLNGLSASFGASANNILLDNIPQLNTNTSENFTDETRRLPSSSDFDSLNLDTGLWDSTISLVSTFSTESMGYTDGLLVGEGKLQIGSRNYGAIVNGPFENVDYSSNMGTGPRTFYRFFSTNVGSANFVLFMQGSGVTFVSANSAFTANNQMKVEYKAPTQTGWLDAYSDFITGQYSDGNGGRAASYGIGRTLNANWGLTIGVKNIVNSNYRVYLKITVPYNFTGYLTNISWTFLT